jgi:hypothetical protein
VFGTAGTGLGSWRPLAAAGPVPLLASATLSKKALMRVFVIILSSSFLIKVINRQYVD